MICESVPQLARRLQTADPEGVHLMLNVNTLLFVGIAVLSIMLAAPVVVPLFENLLNSMSLMPRRY